MPKDISSTVPLPLDELKFYLVPFINSIPEGFIMIDRTGNLIIVHSRCGDMFGYVVEEMIGNNISILIPSVYSSIHKKHIEGFFASPHSRPMGTSGMKLSGVKKSGIHFPIEVSLGFYNAPDGIYAMVKGEVEFIIATGIDLTESLREF